MNNTYEHESHTVAKSVALHLIPGIIAGAVYFLIRAPLHSLGFPSVFALMVAIPLVIVPLELGYLLRKGKQETGRYTLKGVISYRQTLPAWQYIVWSLVVFVAIGLIFRGLSPVDSFLQDKVFSRVPALDTGLENGYGKTSLIITYAAVAVFGAVIGPVAEELYFRGYLLRRMPGKPAILWHSLLFAVYHVFTPWMVVTRTIGLIPLIYAVRKKSIYIGIIVHVLLNSIDAVMGFSYIARMS